MTTRSSSGRGNAPRTGNGERPSVHPLLTFQFESDAGAETSKPRRRGSKKSEPTSIRDAITRWLDEQL